MHDRGFWRLAGVSNDALEGQLRQLIATGSRTEAHVVAHLAEVETRRLHLLEGRESLFDYCKESLGLSGNEAFYRIVAARMAQQFPVIFELLQQRELFITTLPLLRDYLTTDNHAELLQAVRGKSKAQVLELLAARAPRPDARSHIRRLPTTPRSVAAGPSGTLEPLSSVSYRLQLNTSHTLKEKLELARDLMSHANPSGDLAVVVERGLDLLIARLQQRRFGQTSRPRKRTIPSTPAAQPPASKQPPSAAIADIETPTQPTQQPAPANFERSKSRPHIPNEVRRRVIERDGPRCTFTSADGRRCTARALLQFDHLHARARGGLDTPANLRILCAQHNGLQAAHDFGTEHVHAKIQQARKRAE